MMSKTNDLTSLPLWGKHATLVSHLYRCLCKGSAWWWRERQPKGIKHAFLLVPLFYRYTVYNITRGLWYYPMPLKKGLKYFDGVGVPPLKVLRSITCIHSWRECDKLYVHGCQVWDMDGHPLDDIPNVEAAGPSDCSHLLSIIACDKCCKAKCVGTVRKLKPNA